MAAAFAIAQGQRQAQKLTAELRADSREKLTAELEHTTENIIERTRTGFGGTMLSGLERVGRRVEQFATGASRGEVLESTLRFQAAGERDPFVRQQVQRNRVYSPDGASGQKCRNDSDKLHSQWRSAVFPDHIEPDDFTW